MAKGDEIKYGRRTFIDSGHDGRYQVLGYSGVAFTVIGYEAFKDFETGCVEVGPDEQLFGVMVGDDRLIPIDADDLSELKDEEYCSECGQIGCCHG